MNGLGLTQWVWSGQEELDLGELVAAWIESLPSLQESDSLSYVSNPHTTCGTITLSLFDIQN